MADLQLPAPDEQGLYSTTLPPRLERAFIDGIRIELGDIQQISNKNAGNLLFIIVQEGKQFANLPTLPMKLSTLEGCKGFIEEHPDLIACLHEVRNCNAYAWFCEKVIGEREERPTLRDYVLPEASNILDAMMPYIHTTYVPGSRTTTTKFSPRFLDRERLPCSVQYCENLPMMMKAHLLELLDSDEYFEAANRPVSEDIRAAYRYLVRKYSQFNEGETGLTKEAEVQELAADIAGPVTAMYAELTSRNLCAPPEMATSDRNVRTDRVYRLNDTTGSIVILWEDKKPKVGNYYVGEIPRLLQRSAGNSITFDGDDQTRWEKEKAILGKLAWHATDKDETMERPRWAVLFAGNQYLVFLMVYLLDANNNLRAAMFCSPPMQTHDKGFPTTTATLYMALSSNQHFNQEQLLSKLGIPTPASPPTVPPPKQLGPITRARSGQTNPNTVQVQSPGTVALTMCSVSSEWIDEALKKLQFYPVGFTSTPKLSPLILFLENDGIEGAVGTTYRTSGLAIKFAHRDDDAREALLNEAQVYRNLEKNRISSVPVSYGLFASGDDFALLLSDEGEVLRDFSDLSQEQRHQLFQVLQEIHDAGIDHGDFKPSNVVIGQLGRPVVIDFSHSSRHVCQGQIDCTKLKEAHELLFANPSSLYNSPSRECTWCWNVAKWLFPSAIMVACIAWLLPLSVTSVWQ